MYIRRRRIETLVANQKQSYKVFWTLQRTRGFPSCDWRHQVACGFPLMKEWSVGEKAYVELNYPLRRKTRFSAEANDILWKLFVALNSRQCSFFEVSDFHIWHSTAFGDVEHKKVSSNPLCQRLSNIFDSDSDFNTWITVVQYHFRFKWIDGRFQIDKPHLFVKEYLKFQIWTVHKTEVMKTYSTSYPAYAHFRFIHSKNRNLALTLVSGLWVTLLEVLIFCHSKCPFLTSREVQSWHSTTFKWGMDTWSAKPSLRVTKINT
jgi:hypothetical protein